jgi:hypothetical protein
VVPNKITKKEKINTTKDEYKLRSQKNSINLMIKKKEI